MTREGYLKHHDKDYFTHWLSGGQVEYLGVDKKWLDDEYPTWHEKIEYRIKPQNKWAEIPKE